MFIRTFVLVVGLCGALSAAQFPAFSQQYMQRLGGAVDALAVVVANFDASAKAAGLGREEALAQLKGTAFLDRRRQDMTATFARYDRLRNDLAILEGHGPFMRAYHGARLTDAQIAQGALRAFQPSLPLSLASGIFAALGFLAAGTVARTAARLVLRLNPARRRPEPLLA